MQLRFDVGGQAGRAVPLSFRATEDRALATSFAIDDVTLTTT